MLKRIAAVLAVLVAGFAGAVTVAAPAQAAQPAVGVYDAAFGAVVVEIGSLDEINKTDKIVQVMHLSPFAMRSLSQCAQWTYCMWTSTSFGGSVYAWNTAWNSTCVPVGGSMDNNAESFANLMGPNNPSNHWVADLKSTYGCATGGTMESLEAQETDSNLTPWNNILSSFSTWYCSWPSC